jgi:Mrp family chromosome partitioning ATPase
VRYPWEAELAAGVPAVLLERGAPLLLGGVDGCRGVLVLPVGPGARSGVVAARIAATASLRGRDVALADLEGVGESPVAALPAAASPEAPAAPAPAAGAVVPAEHDAALALRPVEGEGGGGYLVYRANGRPAHALRDALGEMEARFAPVVVALKGAQEPATVALLSGDRPVVISARAGKVTQTQLEEAAGMLRRLGVSLVGVVLEPAERGARRPTARA